MEQAPIKAAAMTRASSKSLNNHVSKGQSTYTIKLAGLFVFRVQGKSAEAACERAFKAISSTESKRRKAMEVDESFMVTNVIKIDPRRFEHTPKTIVKEDDDLFEMLSHVTHAMPDPVFVDLKQVEKDAQALLDHVEEVHALKCDNYLHEASTEISTAILMLRKAHLALLRRAESKRKESR